MSEMKTQFVWLPDGFGGGEHTDVCRATDYAALEAERDALRQQLAEMTAYKQTRQSAMDSALAQADALLEVKP